MRFCKLVDGSARVVAWDVRGMREMATGTENRPLLGVVGRAVSRSLGRVEYVLT